MAQKLNLSHILPVALNGEVRKVIPPSYTMRTLYYDLILLFDHLKRRTLVPCTKKIYDGIVKTTVTSIRF